MKIFLYTDVHWMTTSSLINTRGEVYSTKIENLIKSVNWAEKEAVKQGCSEIICLGDFFDKAIISCEEITGLQEVNFVNIPHTCIVGNHESDVASLAFNTTKILIKHGWNVINDVNYKEYDDFVLYYIPYIIESNRKSLIDYLNIFPTNKKKIVLSHNDIKGIQMGMFLSKEGFDKNEIENNCDLFLNGHLHNGMSFCKNGINLGNLTGKTFEEDGFRYKHCGFVLDTDTLSVTPIENPYAFNFYKVLIGSKESLNILDKLKNAIVMFKCREDLKEDLTTTIKNHPEIKIFRTIIYRDAVDISSTTNTAELAIDDYLKKFEEFSLNELGADPIVIEELATIIK